MVPVIQMVITAFTVNAFRGIKSGLTTQWLVKVLELYGDTIVRSLGLALMTLIVCVIVGVPAAWVLVREQRKRWAAFIEEAFILPLSMPGLAVGLGILLIWGGFSYFRQSIFFLLAGHVMFCLPFMVRSVTAVLRVNRFRSMRKLRPRSALRPGRLSAGSSFLLQCREYWRAP